MADWSNFASGTDLYEQELRCRRELQRAVEALGTFRQLCGMFPESGGAARAEAEKLLQNGQQLEENFAELLYRLQGFCTAADNFLLEQAGKPCAAREVRRAMDELWRVWRGRPALCMELLELIRAADGGPWVALADWPVRYGRKTERLLDCCSALIAPLEVLCEEYERVYAGETTDSSRYIMELYGAPAEPPQKRTPDNGAGKKMAPPRPAAPYPACHAKPEKPEPSAPVVCEETEKPEPALWEPAMDVLYGPPEIFERAAVQDERKQDNAPETGGRVMPRGGSESAAQEDYWEDAMAEILGQMEGEKQADGASGGAEGASPAGGPFKPWEGPRRRSAGDERRRPAGEADEPTEELDLEQIRRRSGPVMGRVYAAPPKMETRAEKRRPLFGKKNKEKK